MDADGGGRRDEDGSGERLLIEVPGDPAIEAIQKRGQGVDADREPPEGFLR